MKPIPHGLALAGQSLDFQTLKRHISIHRVLQYTGALDTLRQSQTNLTGPCPIHRGDNPRAFVVSTSKNLWRCFTRCDAGGDVIELVKRLYRCSYPDVAKRLTGMIQPSQPRLPRGPTTKPFTPFTRKLHLHEDHEFLRRKLIRPQTAAQFEVGYYNGNGFLNRSIAVRLHDPYAAPLGYAARHLDPDHVRTYGKWKFPPKLPKGLLLYNIHRLQAPRTLVLVECPWGVLRLHQLGIPALALLGTHLGHQQCRRLRTFKRLVLMMDADKAGRRAATRIAHQLRGHHQLSCATLPDGLDPDQLDDHQIVALLHPFLF